MKSPALRLPEAADPAHQGRFAYFFLLVFTGLLYGRPSDIFWSLSVIPMAQIAAICALVGYLFARVKGGLQFVWTLEVKIVFAITMLFVAGVPFAFWPSNSVRILQTEWFKTVIIFFLLTQVVTSLPRVRQIVWVILLCEFVVAMFSLFSGSEKVIVEAERMMGANRGMLSGNSLGISVATTLPFIAVLVARSKSILKSLFLLSIFGMVMMMVVKTASRASILMILTSLVLVWLLVLRDSVKARLLGLVFAGTIVLAVLFAPDTFWERFGTIWDSSSYATSSSAASAMQSEYQRKALLTRSITWTLERPIFGLGLGNFPIYSGTVTGNAQEWKGTHNTFTQVSSEAGIPAFLLFVGLMVVVTRNMRRIARECGSDPKSLELKQYAYAALISIYAFMFAAWFAHLAYEYHLYYLAGLGVALQGEMQRVRAAAAFAAAPAGAPDSSSNGIGRKVSNVSSEAHLAGSMRGRPW